MAIICVKIGENESNTYGKFHELSKHLDIIDVLPRKRDANDNIIERTMGVQGDKEFLAIHVNMDDLTDEEFAYVRTLLTEKEEVQVGIHPDGMPKMEIKTKRLWNLDNSLLYHLGIDTNKKDLIQQRAEHKRQRVSVDMRDINNEHYSGKKIDFYKFAKAIRHKLHGKTLEEHLELDKKGYKQVIKEKVEG